MLSSQIKIDKESQQPIYKQIVDQVASLYQNGVLREGDRLPTEREFYEEYGIARGTVKRAYDRLAKQGILSVVRGKGAYVQKGMPNARSIDIIDKYLDQLTALSLGPEDIELLVSQKLQERGEREHIVRVGVVERCPELLDGILEALSAFSKIETRAMTLEQALKNPERLLREFDLVVGSESGIRILEERGYPSKEPMIPVVAVISGQTLEALATAIGEDSRVGIFCRTLVYAKFIRWELEALNRQLTLQSALSASVSRRTLEEYLAGKDVLLIAHGYEAYASAEQQVAVRRFERAGGRVIPLQHSLDGGSLLYVEERIRRFRLTHYDLLR